MKKTVKRLYLVSKPSFFIGGIFPKFLPCSWSHEVWEPFGWHVSGIRNLNKGFFMFWHRDLSRFMVVMQYGPWLFRNNSLAITCWSEEFSIDDSAYLYILVWIELPASHPQFWCFLERLSNSLGNLLSMGLIEHFSYFTVRGFVCKLTSKATLRNQPTLNIVIKYFTRFWDISKCQTPTSNVKTWNT